MGEFFGSLYCSLFEDFFGMPLADYLWGTSGATQVSNMFIGIGLSMIGISLFMCVCYYYPRSSAIMQLVGMVYLCRS